MVSKKHHEEPEAEAEHEQQPKSKLKAPQGYKVYSAPALVAVAPNGHKLYSSDGSEWLDEAAYYSR
jgi:hypothetical protein